MQSHGSEDLLGSLLEMVCCEHVGRIYEEPPRRIEIEISGVE